MRGLLGGGGGLQSQPLCEGGRKRECEEEALAFYKELQFMRTGRVQDSWQCKQGHILAAADLPCCHC